MFVELVYDKRNFDGLPSAKDIILGELSKRVHRIFPDADVRVKPMMTLPAINTDATFGFFHRLPLRLLFLVPDTVYRHFHAYGNELV
ncbi:Virulence protein msgA, DinI-like family [Escherichia coli]|nr:Virulence protein msgA, DinI-like family [Escherichia coli]